MSIFLLTPFGVGRFFVRVAFLLVISFVLTACGGSGGKTSGGEDTAHKPVANDVAITLNEDVSGFAITLKGTSEDNKPLTYIIVDQASHSDGDVTINAEGKAIYSVAANYVGNDSFTYKVNDGDADSNVATVKIAISSENDAPVISENHTATVQEDRSKNIPLIASDAENAALIYSIVTAPDHGSVSIEGASATYTPDSNYFGSDSFSFKANDGVLDSNIADVSVTVTAVNDAPIAYNAVATVSEDASEIITLTADDIDSSSLTYSIETQPQHGEVQIAGDKATYTPNNNYSGPDSFTFKAKDNTLFSNAATVNISVKNVNKPPVITQNHSGSVQEDSTTEITLQATDPDGDALVYFLGSPAHGSVMRVTNNGETRARYTPNANYYGNDTFSFWVNDGGSDSNTVQVAVTVTAINDAPIAQNVNVELDAGSSAQITLNATDIDSSIESYNAVTNPQHGSVSITNNMALYTPDNGYSGSDSFTYRVSDGALSSNVAAIYITVRAGNVIKILPLGDSITQAHFSQLSYRYPLWQKLIDLGVNFDFIGSQTQTYYGDRVWPSYNGNYFDQDHEGYVGQTADWILYNANFHDSNPADVALIHLGTNDLLWWDDDGETIKNDIANLINRLRETNPNMKILLAKILPFNFDYPGHNVSSRYYDYISRIDGLAADMYQTNSPVIVVSMTDIYDLQDDRLHPNGTGEEKMAQRWFDAMSSLGIF